MFMLLAILLLRGVAVAQHAQRTPLVAQQARIPLDHPIGEAVVRQGMHLNTPRTHHTYAQ